MKFRSLIASIVMVFSGQLFAAGGEEIVMNQWEVLPVLTVKSDKLPDQSPARWGRLDFRRKQSSHQSMFQPDSFEEDLEPPSLGFDEKGWRKYHGAWLRARKHVPSELSGQHLYFTLDGIRCHGCKLFVNGKEAADIDGRSCHVDVAKLVEFGERNEFLILLDGGNRNDFMLVSGPPTLVPRGPDSIDDVYANVSWREKKLTVELQVSVEKAKTIAAIIKVLDKDGKEVKLIRDTYDVPAGTTVLKPVVKWDDPVAWEFGNGYLYTLATTVRFSDKVNLSHEVRFGFREFWRDGWKIYLNGHEQPLDVFTHVGAEALDVKKVPELGYNTVEFRRTKKEPGPKLDAELFAKLSEAGIGLLGEEPDRHSRNWPCFLRYSAEADGSFADIKPLTQTYDWAPVAEWEDRLLGWTKTNTCPLRVFGVKMPAAKDWYRDGRDCVTEILASLCGDRAYELEPTEIVCGHRSNVVDCAAHPLVGEFESDFRTRIERAWRTSVVNGGFNLTDPEANVVSTNSTFLSWIAGVPRVTDRRHAYESGETVEKSCVMMWSGFPAQKFKVKWRIVAKKKVVASGSVEKELVSGIPVSVPVRYKAPAVKRRTEFTINARFFDDRGKLVGSNDLTFEVLPEAAPLPSGKKLNTAKTRVIAAYSLKSEKDLPWEEIKKGLKVLVLPQSAEVMKGFGFEVDEVLPRRLELRDRISPAFADIVENDLYEWNGLPNYAPAKPRNCNHALCGQLLRTPASVGYLPVIEGGFDGNWSAVIRRFCGKGEIVFSMLSATDRKGVEELKGAAVSDPCAKKVQAALYADLLQPAGPAHNRKICPVGEYATRLAKSLDLQVYELGILPNSVVICGPDSEIEVKDVLSALSRGSNVLIVDNRRLAEGMGFKVGDPGSGVYGVKIDPANPDLRSVGRNLLRFRDRCVFAPLSEAPQDWKIDADGMFASRTFREGGKTFICQLDPFRFEESLKKLRKEEVRRVDMTLERHRQFFARILTLLGAGAAEGPR